MKELLLRLDFPAEELNVIDEKNIGFPLAPLEG